MPHTTLDFLRKGINIDHERTMSFLCNPFLTKSQKWFILELFWHFCSLSQYLDSSTAETPYSQPKINCMLSSKVMLT